jgi:hypothetical protein
MPYQICRPNKELYLELDSYLDDRALYIQLVYMQSTSIQDRITYHQVQLWFFRLNHLQTNHHGHMPR